jgi:hypothetical protein
MLRNILLSFIPLFVAVDAIGVLPIFVSLTEGLSKSRKTKIIIQSMLTAFLLAMGFIYVGDRVFKLLGITLGDFMVAGGAVSIYTNDAVGVTGPIATGYTQVADDIGTVRIDCTNPANVKFYINGTRVCRATTFNLSASAATWQPLLGVWKDIDASEGTLDIDYVRIWQERY